MNTEFSKEIIGMRALNLLFYNYTTEMLNEMLSIREFKHCWENYVNLEEQTHMQIWDFFFNKISFKTQTRLLEISLKHYGEEAAKHYSTAIETDIILQEHIKKHDNLKKK
ncbi:hypothetical protein J2810_004581 [Chryseobacterium rhizosphaerae]|uniref:hypothetical protein n=1 Tax=Chryseobacterium rhizosphaerae TaxID=395937 RepID=UPI002858EEAA|nr:hypothetical protein [Chryseobacterium rhizosphaerae]MDR6548491.1 hypothetical protein [Chryseobacterium rhizosphaerae]